MENCSQNRHEHKGKSSESLVDKNIILKTLNIQSGQIILDAGCGNGYMSKEFAWLTGSEGKVYALDPDEVSIEILVKDDSYGNIDAFVGDITSETKLEALSVDLIYLSTVVHGFTKDQIKGFITEIKRLLKPGGTLAILEINKTDTPFGPPENMRFTPAELIETIGLKADSTIDIGQYFYLQTFINV